MNNRKENDIFMVIVLGFLLCVFSVLLISKPEPKREGLPHRQEWELYRQANSPAEHECPEGTVPFYIFESETPFFLECYRSHTNE